VAWRYRHLKLITAVAHIGYELLPMQRQKKPPRRAAVEGGSYAGNTEDVGAPSPRFNGSRRSMPASLEAGGGLRARPAA
jgi:hypothetical protein